MVRWTWVLVVVLFAAAAAPGQVPSGLVLFGDSLTDVGNVNQASFGFVPGGDYFNGRFSNGPVWAEAMAAELGLGGLVHSRAGGRNYAHGGAETGGGRNNVIIPNVGLQIEFYFDDAAPGVDELFVVWGGANNLLGNLGADVSVPVADLAAHVTELANAGAARFVVPNLPRLGQTPRYVGGSNEAGFDALTLSFNAQLAARLDTLTANLGVEIIPLDIARMFDQLLAEPAAFGLSNVTGQAIAGVPNEDQYLFWDDVHPTGAAHAVLGEVAAHAVLGTAARRWHANAAVGRFDIAANWAPMGLPEPHWQAVVDNDVSPAPRTAQVAADQALDTLTVRGTTGDMRFAVFGGATLTVAHGLSIEPGGIVGGEGTLAATTATTNAGTLDPGEPDATGTLSLLGDFEQLPAGTLTADVANNGHDRLTIDGSAALAGTLALRFDDGFAPGFGAVFDLLTTTGSLAGRFDAITGLTLESIAGLDAAAAVTYATNAVSITIALVGDANLDGTINGLDASTLLANFGSAGGWRRGDFTGDGVIDALDAQAVLANFGQTVGATSPALIASLSALAEPEPGAAVVFGAVGLFVWLRPRRRPRR